MTPPDSRDRWEAKIADILRTTHELHYGEGILTVDFSIPIKTLTALIASEVAAAVEQERASLRAWAVAQKRQKPINLGMWNADALGELEKQALARVIGQQEYNRALDALLAYLDSQEGNHE